MIDYKSCLLPEFVWTDQDYDFFLQQKGEAGKFWSLVYSYYCMDQDIRKHMNNIQMLIILANLHKYPAGTLKLEYYDTKPIWDEKELLLARIACKAIGIEEAFIEKLYKTARSLKNDRSWYVIEDEIYRIEEQIDFSLPFDIDLKTRPNLQKIFEKISQHKYSWGGITNCGDHDTIDYILSLMPTKELKKSVLEDINSEYKECGGFLPF